MDLRQGSAGVPHRRSYCLHRFWAAWYLGYSILVVTIEQLALVVLHAMLGPSINRKTVGTDDPAVAVDYFLALRVPRGSPHVDPLLISYVSDMGLPKNVPVDFKSFSPNATKCASRPLATYERST